VGYDTNVADCRNCGKKLSWFNFGDDPDLCGSCRAERRRQRDRFGSQPDPVISTLGPHKATWGLVAVNVIIFAAMIQAGVSPTRPEIGQLIAKGANFGPKTIGEGEYWRLITSGFLHVGFFHIAMNMLCLWGLARQLERFFGAVTTIAVYVLTTIGAETLSMAYDPFRVSAGASGPIFGITGVLVAFLYYGRHDLTAHERSAALRSTVQFALINLVIGLAANIDNMAHLGGLVTGLLIGFALSRRRREEQHHLPAGVLASAAVILALLIVPVARAKKPQLDLLKAQDAFQRGDWKTAISVLRDRVAREPNDVNAHALLGLCLERDKQVDAAIAEYQAASRLAPSLDPIRFSLVALQIEKQDYAGAKHSLAPLLERQPPQAGAFLYLGQALAGTKEYPAAEAALRKSLALEDLPETHASLAAVLRAQGRVKEADAEQRLAEANDEPQDETEKEAGPPPTQSPTQTPQQPPPSAPKR
jgi:rhomboid protease GluP